MKQVWQSLFILVVFGISACEDSTTAPEDPTHAANTDGHYFTVYKSPTCGCCVGWIDHLKASGLNVDAVDSNAMNDIKKKLGVHAVVQSCHTATDKNGFVYEGHVPAKAITAFQQAPIENAIGLAVPGMPVGSPGMEMNNRFEPYEVLVLFKDGTVKSFMSFDSYESQF